MTFADAECIPVATPETSESNAATPDADATIEFVGIIEATPTSNGTGEATRIDVRRQIEELVNGVYACVADEDDEAVGSYFSRRARADMEEEMSPMALLDRFGPRESFELVELTMLDDDKVLAELEFTSPLGTLVESWILVLSGDNLLIDGVWIPPLDGATPAA